MKNIEAPDRSAILTRLRRVEGQIRGIQRMIEDERECDAIVTQLMAARSALDRAGMQIMTRYISVCLTEPGDEVDQKQLDRIISFFFKFAGQSPTGGTQLSEPGGEIAAQALSKALGEMDPVSDMEGA